MTKCVLCQEQITNPLGPKRISEEMVSWLVEAKPELIKDFRNTAEELCIPVKGADKCIFDRVPMNVCAYCFTKHIFAWLKDTDKTLLREYLTFFNFDVTRQGYTKEYQAMFPET